MIVEPYNYKFPFRLTSLELPVSESNYLSNAEDSAENWQSAFGFNEKGNARGSRSRLTDLFCRFLRQEFNDNRRSPNFCKGAVSRCNEI